ncbi:hypothetical protein WSS15_00570 [Acetobacter pasteurianus]|nr:hypothetical protein WSS15_00570 [Acetobacter pasteurianus]
MVEPHYGSENQKCILWLHFVDTSKPIRVLKRNKPYFVQGFSLARTKHAFYAYRKKYNNEERLRKL